MLTRNERESTFLLCKDSIQDFFRAVIENRKKIDVLGIPMTLEKGKKSLEIQLLASDNFSATRTSNGVRHRIKVKIDKSCRTYIYSRKKFCNGHRSEENCNFGSNIIKLESVLAKMPPIDSVLAKQSIKYNCINHGNGTYIVFRIDACYAVDPQTGEINEKTPFFCFEIEEGKGLRLEDFMQSNFFIEQIKPFLYEMPYNSHNRIRLCQNCWPNRILKPDSIDDYISYVQNKFNSIVNRSVLSNLQNIYLRGDKAVERGSKTELEFKFTPISDISDIISHISSRLSDSYSLIETAPRIIRDVYLDEDFCLLQSESQFRVRKRKKGEGWIACFKEKKDCMRTEVLTRGKTRSMITDRDMFCFYSEGVPLPGQAYEQVNQFMRQNFNKEASSLYPIVLVNQYRSRFVVRHRRGNLLLDNYDGYSYTMSDLLHIIFDVVEVIDLRVFSKDELQYFFLQGELDVTKSYFAMRVFTTAEIEPNLREDVKGKAEELFEEVSNTLLNYKLAHKERRNKYQLAIEQLQL